MLTRALVCSGLRQKAKLNAPIALFVNAIFMACCRKALVSVSRYIQKLHEAMAPGDKGKSQDCRRTGDANEDDPAFEHHGVGAYGDSGARRRHAGKGPE